MPPPKPVGRQRALEVVRQVVAIAWFVGTQQDGVQLVEEEQAHDQARDDSDTAHQDPGAQLPKVIRQRHPAVRTDGVVRFADEEADDPGNGHV